MGSSRFRRRTRLNGPRPDDRDLLFSTSRRSSEFLNFLDESQILNDFAYKASQYSDEVRSSHAQRRRTKYDVSTIEPISNDGGDEEL